MTPSQISIRVSRFLREFYSSFETAPANRHSDAALRVAY